MSAKPSGFSKTLYVGWGDLDANGHMRNTAYLDKAADVRMYYFADHVPEPRVRTRRHRPGRAEGRDRVLP